jgi:hypothetical protein
MEADVIKREFQHDVDAFVTGVMFHKGSVVGVLKKHCRSDADYRLVLKSLTGHTSSKDMSEAQFHALYKFVLPFKPEGGKWDSQRGDDLTVMCNALVNAAVDVPEQGRFA